MSQIRKVNWATDKKFLNVWQNEPGLIIGSGPNQRYEDHLPQKKMLSFFPGKIIGCNETFCVLDPGNIDLIIWIDDVVWTRPKCQPIIVKHECLKMCVDPFDWKGDYLEMDITGLKANPPSRFSTSFDSGFYPCNQTGYLALNVALLMGLDPVWLYGFDAWKHPYFNKAVQNYPMAKDWIKENNKKIYIADKDSFLCTMFEYKPLPDDGKGDDEEGIVDGMVQ